MRYFALLVVLFAASAAAAASFDAPKRKSGLWEINISSGQKMPFLRSGRSRVGVEKRRRR